MERQLRPGARSALWVAVALALATVLAASCGGDLSATPPGPIVPGTSAHPRAVNVILRDYVFVPTPILLVPGETVRFQLINGGLVEHEFVLGPQLLQDAYERADAAAAPSLPDATARPVSLAPALAATGLRIVLASGHQASVLYRVPSRQAPTLLLECHIPGHLAKGMVGRIAYVAPRATGP
ncbi:MAG: hypothetical protein ACRDGL_10190 [Candidatus Limnocylindrales bacterium]